MSGWKRLAVESASRNFFPFPVVQMRPDSLTCVSSSLAISISFVAASFGRTAPVAALSERTRPSSSAMRFACALFSASSRLMRSIRAFRSAWVTASAGAASAQLIRLVVQARASNIFFMYGYIFMYGSILFCIRNERQYNMGGDEMASLLNVSAPV